MRKGNLQFINAMKLKQEEFTVVAKIVRTADRSKNTDSFLPPKHDFIMFMKHADSCSEHNKYQMK